jgi:hypothetical protein
MAFDERDPLGVGPARILSQALHKMGWLAPLGAALYYHPWISITVIGVAVPLIGVTINARRRT